jgi:flavin reductase (DIM6/NTAB) family NADH-FMN oxidoreductase RutF
MDIDLQSLRQNERYKLLTALVVPRPIAWITTLNEDGSVNAAPYSFFNVLGNLPPLVAFGPGERRDGTLKDTQRNIECRKNFVVNLVSERVADAMHRTAAPFPPGVSEVTALGLETEPSHSVETPRLAACKVHLECSYHSTVRIGENHVVFGLAQHIHARDGILDEKTLHMRPGAFDGVGRLQGPGWYCSTKDRFDLGSFPTVESALAGKR